MVLAVRWRGLEEAEQTQPAATLKEELDRRRALADQYVPAETQAVHRRAVEAVQASGLLERILPLGAAMPEFQLPDQNGTLISSSDLLRNGKLILCFFRGRWCPFCVAQMEAMNRILPEIQALGASVVAISPQTVKQGFFMHDQHQLRFPLLSDAGNKVARQFGIVYSVSDEQRAIYSRSFTNLPFLNGEASWELPVPATYVVDQDGRVVYVQANADYTGRTEPADIIAFLRK